ncbi:MAG: endonuclease/exonuclease/phosphatase family protein, partial [Planctomycetales bacterium]
ANRANASPGKRFRTIAFNVHRCEGTVPRFLQAKKARAPACVGKKFADALASLAPDLVTFAEAPDEALCRIIADRLKMSCVYFPSRSAYPGVLLSTWRITESQDRAKQAPAGLFSRHWGSAILRDGTRAVIVHSAHLHPNHRSKRRREIEILSQAIQPELAGGKMVLAQGDFNHSPRATEYREWIRRGLIDAFDAKGIGAGETFPSIQPVMRIDYVFVSPSLAPRLRLARTLSDSPFRRQFPQACLSDHLPAAAEFEF